MSTKSGQHPFEDSVFKGYSEDARLSISSHRPQTAEANSAFIGQIVNDGSDTWNMVEILLELFEKYGQFIEKCSSYLDGSIAPGETRNFKVSCPDCRENPMPKYDHYTIEIVDAMLAQSGSGD